MRKFLLSISISLIYFVSLAQAPAGYYDDAQGKTGYTLKSALHTIITNGHNDKGYSALYSAYEDGDTDPDDGYVWDMYSENPDGQDPYNFTHYTNNCGNYSAEGDCYNREHLMPQSVFSSASPMKNDYFHVVPSDGYVNGKRGSYPFGEVDNASWTSQNGSEVGSNVTAGYGGTVFEPIDEYKGDIARSLMYFATRYETQVDSWYHEMLNGTEDQVFSDWFLAVLLDWHNQDPVSQKEITRNNAGYDFQGNRNPFIDHPEWVECIWNNNCSGLSFTSTPIESAVQDQVYSYLIEASGDDGKTLTISEDSNNPLPSWLSLENPTKASTASKLLTGTPTSNDLGTANISIKLSDGTNEVFQTFSIEVTDGNSLAFTSNPVLSAKEDTEYSYTVTATGNDGVTLTITAETKPAWLTLDQTTKSTTKSMKLYGTPTNTDLGEHDVSLKLTDGTKTLYQDFKINVVSATAGSVIISQYYEGYGNDKFIEITNVGSSSVDLSGYYLGRWSGTASPSGKYDNGSALSGSIDADETQVYAEPDATNPSYAVNLAVTTTQACYFNGDDPIALMQGGDTWEDRVDCFYHSDASFRWGENKSFYRKAGIITGNLNVSAIDGTGEWTEITLDDVANAATNHPAYLGFHGETPNSVKTLSASKIRIYPNPADDFIDINVQTGIAKVEILSITGQSILNENFTSTKVKVNIKTLDSGMYFIKVTDFTGRKAAKRLLVK